LKKKRAIEGKSMSNPTWKAHGMATHGRLSSAAKNSLPASALAFPGTGKEPMTDATHVRDAMARFSQVQNVSDPERDLAFANIQKAASHFNIQMKETDWHQFGSRRV
jgi:hypothetical protein